MTRTNSRPDNNNFPPQEELLGLDPRDSNISVVCGHVGVVILLLLSHVISTFSYRTFSTIYVAENLFPSYVTSYMPSGGNKSKSKSSFHNSSAMNSGLNSCSIFTSIARKKFHFTFMILMYGI